MQYLLQDSYKRYRGKHRKLWWGFVDLEKAFDRVLRKVVEWAMRKLGVEEWLVRAVMAMYKHARGSVLSPLLFTTVMEAVTHSVREGLPWEMLYADDLVLVRKCEEELKEKLRKWNECLKDKGLKINEDKTKVMCESFGTGTTQVIGNVKHPCSVCLKGVGVNSIRCTQCVRCSRVKGSLKNVELCETRQVNSQVNGLYVDGHEYEIIDKLCYLGDMLSQEGGCEHAILKRIQTGWLKFRELSGLLIGKEMSLKSKGII